MNTEEQTAVIEVTKKTVKSQIKPTLPPEPTIYVGPNLAGGVLARYTVFKDGKMLPHVQELLEQNPDVKALIVPVSKLAVTEQQLADPSSVVAAKFNALQRKGVNK